MCKEAGRGDGPQPKQNGFYTFTRREREDEEEEDGQEGSMWVCWAHTRTIKGPGARALICYSRGEMIVRATRWKMDGYLSCLITHKGKKEKGIPRSSFCLPPRVWVAIRHFSRAAGRISIKAGSPPFDC